MFSLEIRKLLRAYEQRECTPLDIVDQVYADIAREAPAGVFIGDTDRLKARAAAVEVMRRHDAGERLPLYGVPFAVKDNIDVEGWPTTAACPAFSYTPERSAHVVTQLVALGAIPIGKTNLDQFATGLVGLRTPFTPPAKPRFSRRSRRSKRMRWASTASSGATQTSSTCWICVHWRCRRAFATTACPSASP
ncbi:MAG TPA: amidase family protein [Polyangiales bacterium]|nr:amidase family protein [Polyangiales bacterium]